MNQFRRLLSDSSKNTISRFFHVQIPPPATNNVNIVRFADVLARSFDSLPVSKYMGTSTLSGASKEYIDNWYQNIVTDYSQNGAILVESHDHNVVAIWLPPGFKKKIRDEQELNDLPPNAINIINLLYKINEKYGYDIKDHWHLQYLGKDPQRPSVKGAVSSVIKPFLQNAKQNGIPVVLESANEKATQIYKHYGFESLEKFSVDGDEMFELMVYNKCRL